MPSSEGGSGPSIDVRGVVNAARSIWRGLFGKRTEDCGGVPCPPGKSAARLLLEGDTRTEEERARARGARSQGRPPAQSSAPSYGGYDNPRRLKDSKKRLRKKLAKGTPESQALAEHLRKNAVWPYTLLDENLGADEKLGQTIQAGIETGLLIPGPSRARPRGLVRPGSRFTQQGFLDLSTKGVEAPRVKDPTVRAPPARPVAVPVLDEFQRSGNYTDMDIEVLRRAGIEEMPRTDQEIALAERALEEWEIGQATPLTEYDVEAIGRQRVGTAQQVHSGSGPTAPAPSPARGTGPAGTSAPGTGKTGSGTRVALPTLGKIVLPFDALFTYALGKSGRRSAAPRQASRIVGTATPLTGRGIAPTLDPMIPFAQPAAQRSRTVTDTCTCTDEKKERKPRKPRAICWRGTYIETARGLKKERREQVPC